MASAVVYKCPVCRATLEWQPTKNGWVCEYCDGEFTLDQLGDQANSKVLEDGAEEGRKITGDEKDWTSATDDSTYKDDLAELVEYSCPNCMGKVVTSKTTAATTCVFCNKPVVLSVNAVADFKPKKVIPFKTDAPMAENKFKEFMKKPLTPPEFYTQVQTQKVQGIYVPFHVYSGHAKGGFTCTGKHSYTQGDYRITEVYDVARNANITFDDIPVDALRKIENAAMDSIEPFDMKEAQEFNVAYLSGFLAERYDETSKDCEPRAIRRIQGSMHNYCVKDVESNLSLSNFKDFCDIKSLESDYYMFPAWLLHCEYKDKYYLFAMNGQTGKFIGNLPINWGKLMAITGSISAVVSVLLGFLG